MSYCSCQSIFDNLIVAEGEVNTSLYSLSRRRSEYRLVITEPEATNCFSINFQVFTNNNPHNLNKFIFTINSLFTKFKISQTRLCVALRLSQFFPK